VVVVSFEGIINEVWPVWGPSDERSSSRGRAAPPRSERSPRRSDRIVLAGGVFTSLRAPLDVWPEPQLVGLERRGRDRRLRASGRDHCAGTPGPAMHPRALS